MFKDILTILEYSPGSESLLIAFYIAIKSGKEALINILKDKIEITEEVINSLNGKITKFQIDKYNLQAFVKK